jgi:hypothetical protein
MVDSRDRSLEMDDFSERHYAHDASSAARFRAMGERNEANVTAALWDLADVDLDGLGVAPGFMDRVQGSGLRGIVSDIKSEFGGWWNRFWSGRPTLREMYDETWRPRYGVRAYDVMTLNGARP